MATGKPRLTEDVLTFWKSIVFLITPVILCPLPFYYANTENSKIAACAYAVIIMAVYWTGDILPLAVTALLPIAMFPILGIQPSRKVCVNYLNDMNFLMIGGLMVAVAMERWNLHKRIALKAVLMVGVEPRWLMLGMMSVTAFLSMWISNMATTAMMVPIAQAISAEILKDNIPGEREEGQGQKKTLNPSDDENTVLLSTTTSRNEQSQELPLENIAVEKCDDDDDDMDLLADQARPSAEQADRTTKGLLLCICYAANIGGTATLIGTAPNILVVQTVQTMFPKSPGIDFASWFFFGFPTMVLTLLLAWLWLQWQFVSQSCVPGCASRRGCGGKCQRHKNVAAYKAIRRQYDELGPFSFAESVVLVHFILLVLLWFFRDMKFIKLENGQAAGWAYFFVRDYVTDSSAVLLICLSLFIWPARPPSRGREDLHPSDDEPGPSILDWPTVERNLSWEVIILLGGGYALADGVKVSGLSAWMGQGFRGLEGFSPAFIVIIITIMIAFITEFSSNTSAASIFLPILGTLAQGICVHPYYLMIPAAIACSFAFMLPVATPANAIVFSYGRIKVLDMAKSGLGLNLLCLFVLNIAINTYGVPLYQLQDFPPWTVCTAPVTTAGPSATSANITTLVGN
ncbi:solute carrier family 13 member 2-like [Branchiostoma floridae x Branchiostoma belcheri]